MQCAARAAAWAGGESEARTDRVYSGVTQDPPTAEQFAPSPRDDDDGPGLQGRTIGPYKVLSLLGEGGFGSVYLAEQTLPVHRIVALKVVKPGMDSRAVIARFEAERQALALMDHPSVATVLDAGQSPEGRPYFVMEVVRGEPITRFCALEGLGVDDRVRLMIQVCGAVQHAHMKGVIHRDLKPTNVLVQMVDGKPLAKVIDFGVAKALHHSLGENSIHTEHGQVIGTPEYVSPEQVRDSADVDTRADVYALGAILYELLTGITPLDPRILRSRGLAGLQRAIEETIPAAPSQRLGALAREGRASPIASIDTPSLRRRVRGELDWIVMKCLEKSRSRRYDSAAALAADLERYLNDEPVLAGPPTRSYRAAKFIRRHRVAVFATTAVGLALVGCVIGIAWGLAEALHGRKQAQELSAAAERARDESEEVTRFLTRMIQSVQPDESGRDVTVVEVLDAASKDLATAFADRPGVEARLRHALGTSYWQLGRLDDAEKHLPVAMEIGRRTLGPDDVQTLRSTVNLASLRLEQGREGEAEALLKEAVDGLSRTFGEDHPMTLGALSNLAVVHSRRTADEEAVALHRRALEGQRRVQGPEHPHTLGALLNLADLLSDMNRLDEAEPLMREAASEWERVHGADHPGTLLALFNLAMLELRLGRSEEAETTMRRVVEGRGRIFGEAHHETLAALANLGEFIRESGDAARAEPISLAAWEGMRAALGDAHPTTIQVASMLMETIEAQGWPAGSHDTVVRVIDFARAAATQADIPAASLDHLAWMLSNVEPRVLRDHVSALALALRACKLERAAGGSDLWKYLGTLAAIQYQTGAHATAAASLREALRLAPPAAQDDRAELEIRLRGYEQAALGW